MFTEPRRFRRGNIGGIIRLHGTVIGRDFNSDFLELKSGDNAVVAGGSDSPFCFRLSVA